MYSRPENSTSLPPTSLFDFRIASDDHVDRNLVAQQLVRIDVDLVLPHKSADRRNLGDARERLQRITQIPVLVRAHLVETVLPAGIHQCILIDPADRGSILRQFDVDAFGQPRSHRVQVLEGARTRPVDIRALVENEVDIGVSEVRKARMSFTFGMPSSAEVIG